MDADEDARSKLREERNEMLRRIEQRLGIEETRNDKIERQLKELVPR